MTQNQQNAQSCSLDIYITVLPYLLTYNTYLLTHSI